MRRILIYGAGEAGKMVLEEIVKHPEENFKVLGFLDDDGKKHGSKIDGVPVLGGRESIVDVVKKYRIDEIIISMPSISKKNIREIVSQCKAARVSLLIVPSTLEIIKGRVRFDQIKRLDLADLLDRKEYLYDRNDVKDYIEGKNVVVTGAAGSIGKVLALKLLDLNPEVLVALDKNESGLFYLTNDIKSGKRGDKNNVMPVVGDIKEKDFLGYVFEKYKPDIVFHAAAYKHVPLMEKNVHMAFLNNVAGTLNLLEVSEIFSVERFIGISTDKAVYPHSVMGKTKRITELLVKAFSDSCMKTCSVRFGNVLGSDGSVVRVFEEQIRRGGPITVTDPDMERFFMTVNEAVSLVIKAGKIGDNGDVYVLDMGKPIKIRELAENLIILSGYLPYRDIDIIYTGIRDGERITETLFHSESKVEYSEYDGIMIERNNFVETGIIDDIKSLKGRLFELTEKEVSETLNSIIALYSGGKLENKVAV